MIYPGLTLKATEEPYHRWVVLSDPLTTDGKIVLVNLTSLDDHCVDDACILCETDYSELTHKTTVAYSRRRIGTAAHLQAAIDKGLMRELSPMPPSTFAKILAGANVSPELSKADLRLIKSSC